MHAIGAAGVQLETAAAITRGGVLGNPRQGLIMGTWGFFIGFAAVALYGPAAHAFHIHRRHVGAGVRMHRRRHFRPRRPA